MMQNLRLLIIPGLIAVLVFTGITIFESATRQPEEFADRQEPAYDIYSEGINTVHYNEQGDIEYTLSATRQIHYLTDITEFTAPLVQLYQEQDSRWNIVANSGRISAARTNGMPSNDQEINLIGNVRIYGIDQHGRRTVLETEQLAVNPDRKTVMTDLPVFMVSGPFSQTATGMFANLADNEISFQNDVRGRYATTSE
ncbi:MAG: LPS export ABC transporter periplasmic protein LptC [Pseudohongiellaceae bacterium]